MRDGEAIFCIPLHYAVPDVIEEVLNTYLDLRTEGERFVDTYRRVGIQAFKERAYA